MTNPLAVQRKDTQSEKLQGLQILRFLAATLVVAAHGIDTALNVGSSRPWIAFGNLENFGAVGVDIFFVLSGFIITRTMMGTRHRFAAGFLADRVRRVVPIYWLLSLPFLGLALKGDGVSIPAVVTSLAFWPFFGPEMTMPILGVGWTLCFEMLFYLAATLVLAIKKPAAVVVILIFYLLMLVINAGTGWPVALFLGNPIILEFLFGVVVAVYATRGNTRLGSVLLGAAILGFALNLVLGFGSISEAEEVADLGVCFRRVVSWGLPAMALVAAAVMLEAHIRNAGFVALRRALVFLGDASYSIYLVHTLVLFIGTRALQILGWDLPGDIVVLVGVLASLGVGAATFRFVEKPMLEKLRRLQTGWRPNSGVA